MLLCGRADVVFHSTFCGGISYMANRDKPKKEAKKPKKDPVKK